jgi:hypothetical protein
MYPDKLVLTRLADRDFGQLGLHHRGAGEILLNTKPAGIKRVGIVDLVVGQGVW